MTGVSVSLTNPCRSPMSAARVMPDDFPIPDNSQIFGRVVRTTSPPPDALLEEPPPAEGEGNTLQLSDLRENGQRSAGIQVSLLIHLKDPLELHPHVKTDSE
ncbi:hypothetical protein ILYODFUR_035068 [Ilyodon furcidens]|uniref:Uncharacterized protein n=1 Tax=Ilyodon furcidens TaxID=33524 RepID=A0ABV0UXR0_9TELE